MAEFLNNQLKNSTAKAGEKALQKAIKKYGDDKAPINLQLVDDKYMPEFGIKRIVPAEGTPQTLESENSIALGNIKMGFGHYRIALAFASWIKYYGYNPLWLDLLASEETATAAYVRNSEKLYAKGSRISAKNKLFNKYVWEKVTYTGFRNLKFAYQNYRTAEIFSNYMANVDRKIPIISTHGWAAQASSYHFDNAYQAIPDNFALGLYLTPKVKSFTQTPSLYTNYLSLRNFGKEAVNQMDEKNISYVGHFIDRELTTNIDNDCRRRIDRHKDGSAKRFLFSIGGSGAQAEYLKPFITEMMADVKAKKATIFMNVGTHKAVIDVLNTIPGFEKMSKVYSNNYTDQKKIASSLLSKDNLHGIHVFHNDDTMPAVYITNLLMRGCDILVTKPSELAFYPVPKMHIKHVGKHETHGGLHAEEIGDAIFEAEEQKDLMQVYRMIMTSNVTKVLNEEIMRNNKAEKYDGAKKIVQQIIRENFND